MIGARGDATPEGKEGSKLIRGIRGRRRDRDRFSSWAEEARDPERPLAWIHAPSVGEGLQAKAVLEAFRARRPDLQFAYTHFSPSAEGLARRMPADVSGYLPWDSRPAVTAALDALRPDLLLFTKTEVWPVLVLAAAERGIPVALVAATLPESAGRRRPLGRAFLAPAFRSLTQVMAISPEDGARFAELGVVPTRVLVTGDPGIDSAWERAQAADPGAPYLAPLHGSSRPTLVAGSTWGADEAVLLPALGKVREKVRDLRLIIAPHEPDQAHLAPLEQALKAGGWRVRRLGEVERRGDAHDVDAVVVDRVGVLAHLYSVGQAAYVGGGFHSAGLHSVLEPAASGIPVVFGPRFANSLAAEELKSEGGGVSVGGEAELARVLLSWLETGGDGEAVGAQARSYLLRHRGAAARTVDALLPLIS
jgi:3-deoxy-D-manno-octulosonic-acid transferase